MYRRWIKRVLDCSMALLGLIVLSPLLLVVYVWLTIANKGAGAIFTQERPGKDEKIFKLYKFKSMTDERDTEGNLLPDAQRLTKVGRFVRKTSIDELPQLWNVLKGDMSFIGPRPLTPIYLELFDEKQKRRHEVRPGITGWAQVNGRNLLPLSKKFEFDVWYVDHCSFRVDCKIFFMTIKNVLARNSVGEGQGNMKEIDDLGFLPKILAMKNNKMKKEIGSNFWLSQEELSEPLLSLDPKTLDCAGSDFVWTSTGRSAISLVLQSIEEEGIRSKRVLLPIFTCHTVVEPFIKNGYEVYPFYIDEHLRVMEKSLCQLIEKVQPSVLLFHNYFGFETCNLSQRFWGGIRENGIIVIEDCTQSLYSGFRCEYANFYIASIRKWCGVPDGGFAVRRKGVFTHKPIDYDKPLEKKKVEASLLKHDYIINDKGDKNSFLSAFKEAEMILNEQQQVYSISPISLRVQEALDISSLKKRRRKNYAQLFDAITRSKDGLRAALPEIKEDDQVVPLYFPIYCLNRKATQKLLASHDIYAPILWPCPQEFEQEKDNTAEYIYDNLLCIPIDQRYNSEDMERILEVLA